MNRTLQQSSSSMIKTGVWEDEAFIDSHTIEDRFMLIYLLTCPHRSMSGIVKLNYRVMTSHLGLDKEHIQAVIDKLIKLGDISISGSFVWIKSYFDHNSLPAPTHFNQINSRLQEVPEDMLEAWRRDAAMRKMPVDKFFQSNIEVTPDTYLNSLCLGTDDPSDTLALKDNNNDKCKDSEKNNYNNNEKNINGGSEFIFPKELDVRLKPEITKLLLNCENAQFVIDELAAGLSKGKILEPVAWVAKVLKSTFYRTAGGLQKEEQRNARKQ